MVLKFLRNTFGDSSITENSAITSGDIDAHIEHDIEHQTAQIIGVFADGSDKDKSAIISQVRSVARLIERSTEFHGSILVILKSGDQSILEHCYFTANALCGECLKAAKVSKGSDNNKAAGLLMKRDVCGMYALVFGRGAELESASASSNKLIEMAIDLIVGANANTK